MKQPCYTTLAVLLLTSLFFAGSGRAQNIPSALETITADDGSVWELVNDPGFGNNRNISIDALCPFQGRLYALTRNDSEGCELWRTQGTGWEKVSVPGFTDSPLHDYMQGGYGDMIEFKDHLYVATSSGYEGKFYYKGIGSEIWRFDGSTWEPVASYAKDDDESGTITAISGCSADDGDTTAQFTDSSKNWTADQWKDSGLIMMSGDGRGRYLKIIGNTANTLTVQEDEAAFAAGVENEYTVCDEHAPDSARKEVTVGRIAVNDKYSIAVGEDENGFGNIWNKSIVDLEELNGELYVSIGHNYQDGTSAWKTADGVTFKRITAYAHGNIHGYGLNGNPINCYFDNQEATIGVPVCTSSTHFGKSAVSGTETLYLGATGSRGCNGNGARVLRLEEDTFHFIVERLIDDNAVGTNESGFGDDAGGDALVQNFQAWQFAEYDNKLFCGVARVVGCRLAYTETGGSEDDAWKFVVGYDEAMPNGFDGVAGPLSFGSNVGIHLSTFKNALYIGTMKVKLYENPIPVIDPAWDGSDLWRATGPADSLVWTRITANAFGDQDVQNFDSFCTYNNTLYVTAGYYFGKNLDAKIPETAATKIYRLKELPSVASFTSFTAQPGKFSATISWTTGIEPDCAGFNVYQSTSEKYNRPYTKLNNELIPAKGSLSAGNSYSFPDNFLRCNRTYFYKIESVSASGKSTFVGPLGVTTKKLLGR